jgi:hypothetical protein
MGAGTRDSCLVFDEIKENRVAWPGPALPAPLTLNGGNDV